MPIKIIGSIFVVVSCGSLGLKIVYQHIKEEKTLQQLISVLDFMECELLYRLTPLPSLCRQAACECNGILQQIFYALATELEDQISPDVERCMNAALCTVKDIPKLSHEALAHLGRAFGRFDMDGQLKALEAVRQDCRRNLENLNINRDARLRSYQTLGLCAGAAIVILFI